MANVGAMMQLGTVSRRKIDKMFGNVEPQPSRRCRVGDSYDGYRIVKLIGAGGMAEVYQALHDVTERTVALKVLNERYWQREDIVERARREAKALARVDHPSVVRIMHAAKHPTLGLYIVMELLNGVSLRAIMHRAGALPLVEATRMAILLAEATHELHAVGIFHRDIKPENVIVQRHDDGMSLKLLDLGAAKIANDLKERTTDIARTVGTGRYMSPEHIKRGIITEASDQYSLGHVLYEMLAGHHALGDNHPRPGHFDFLAWHLHATVTPLAEARDDIPAALSQVVARSMCKEPSARYPSMLAFAAALEQALATLSEPGAPSASPASDAWPTEDTAHSDVDTTAPLRRGPTGTAIVGVPTIAHYATLVAGAPNFGTEVMEPEPVGTDTVGTDTVGTDTVAPDTVATSRIGLGSVAPGAAAPGAADTVANGVLGWLHVLHCPDLDGSAANAQHGAIPLPERPITLGWRTSCGVVLGDPSLYDQRLTVVWQASSGKHVLLTPELRARVNGAWTGAIANALDDGDVVSWGGTQLRYSLEVPPDARRQLRLYSPLISARVERQRLADREGVSPAAKLTLKSQALRQEVVLEGVVTAIGSGDWCAARLTDEHAPQQLAVVVRRDERVEVLAMPGVSLDLLDPYAQAHNPAAADHGQPRRLTVRAGSRLRLHYAEDADGGDAGVRTTMLLIFADAACRSTLELPATDGDGMEKARAEAANGTPAVLASAAPKVRDPGVLAANNRRRSLWRWLWTAPPLGVAIAAAVIAWQHGDSSDSQTHRPTVKPLSITQASAGPKPMSAAAPSDRELAASRPQDGAEPAPDVLASADAAADSTDAGGAEPKPKRRAPRRKRPRRAAGGQFLKDYLPKAKPVDVYGQADGAEPPKPKPHLPGGGRAWTSD